MSSPRLFTSRWANRDLADVDATMVSISRGQPRWKLPFRYRMAPELAPSKATFRIEDEQAFAEAYTAQLDALGLDGVLGRLGRVAAQHPGKPLVLLCYEPADQPCHRHLFADWFEEQTGIQIPELQAGMILKHPNTTTPTLF